MTGSPTVTDDELSAFLDGELDADALQRIAAAIENDGALRRRAEELAAPDAIIREAYSAIDDLPMPEAVTALLADRADQAADNVVRLRPRATSRPAAPWAMPLAASIALGAGVALGLAVSGPGATQGGGAMIAGAVSPADALHAALETTPSGETIALAGARTASMVLSFRSGEKWCREFTLTDGKSASRAIACREDGQWSVKLAASELASGGGYATASGGVAAAFEAGASALGADEPLDRAAEDALLGD